jgi:hypothetical protein
MVIHPQLLLGVWLGRPRKEAPREHGPLRLAADQCPWVLSAPLRTACGPDGKCGRRQRVLPPWRLAAPLAPWASRPVLLPPSPPQPALPTWPRATWPMALGRARHGAAGPGRGQGSGAKQGGRGRGALPRQTGRACLGHARWLARGGAGAVPRRAARRGRTPAPAGPPRPGAAGGAWLARRARAAPRPGGGRRRAQPGQRGETSARHRGLARGRPPPARAAPHVAPGPPRPTPHTPAGGRGSATVPSGPAADPPRGPADHTLRRCADASAPPTVPLAGRGRAYPWRWPGACVWQEGPADAHRPAWDTAHPARGEGWSGGARTAAARKRLVAPLPPRLRAGPRSSRQGALGALPGGGTRVEVGQRGDVVGRSTAVEGASTSLACHAPRAPPARARPRGRAPLGLEPCCANDDAIECAVAASVLTYEAILGSCTRQHLWRQRHPQGGQRPHHDFALGARWIIFPMAKLS